jgi:hypothetical protein
VSIEFIQVKNWPGYWVNNLGEVWSSKKQVHRGKYHGGFKSVIGDTPTKKLSPGLRNGYPFVVFTKPGKRQGFSVHHLVLRAFHGPKPFENAVCRHLDGNPLNNTVDNLKWGTHKENTQDAVKAGIRGAGGFNTSFSEEDITKIRATSYELGLFTKLGEEYDVTSVTISDIYYGKTWEHLPGANKPRLNEESVKVIKSYDTYHGINQDLASEYGVSPGTISSIRNGRTWAHVGTDKKKTSHNPYRKLTDDEVRDIKSRKYHRHLVSDLAEQYGVNKVTIRNIRSGKTWQHVK